MTDVKLLGNDDKTYASSFIYGYIYLARFQAVETGTFNSMKVLFTGANTVKLALYSDVSGPYPGSVLSKNEDDNATINGWQTISMPEYDITSGNYYWLACYYPVSSYRIKYNSGVGQSIKYKTFPYTNSFPDPIPAGYSSGTAEIAIAGWGSAGSPPANIWGGTWGG